MQTSLSMYYVSMLQQLGLTQAIPLVHNKVTQGRDLVQGYHNALPWPQPTCTRKQKKKNACACNKACACDKFDCHRGDLHKTCICPLRCQTILRQPWVSPMIECLQWPEICKFHWYYHTSLHNRSDEVRGFKQSWMAIMVNESFRIWCGYWTAWWGLVFSCDHFQEYHRFQKMVSDLAPDLSKYTTHSVLCQVTQNLTKVTVSPKVIARE